MEVIQFIASFNLHEFFVTAKALIISNPIAFLWWIFSGGGWVFFVIPIPFIAKFTYMNYIWDKWHAKIPYVLLAIDVPTENEQSIQAVEQMFYQFWTIYLSKNLIEKYIEGQFQLALSFEIVSIGGYIQFIIRTPEQHRDHVEATVYAQFPDAEITEIEDYTKNIPSEFPNDTHNWWGTEFRQAKNPAYPIRTYPFFEHQLKQVYTDPMAGILEAMSKIGHDEQIWIQLVATPLKHSWHEKFQPLVEKLIGAKKPSKPPGYFRTQLTEFGKEVGGQVSGSPYGPAAASNASEDPPTMMLHLSPGERSALESVQIKLSKPGFLTKLRVIYIAKKDIYNTIRGIGPIFGGLNQFTALDMNAMVLGKWTTTHVDYFFTKSRTAFRKRNLMKYYKARSQSMGEGNGMYFNTEELASIFHFPVTEVLAPGIKRSETRKAKPPLGLPEEIVRSILDDEETEDLENELESVIEPEDTTPTVTKPDVRFGSDLDSDIDSSSAKPPDNLPV